ncbi:glycosyltransferase [Gluconacetobacter sacchari DSM 12717]|uniref:Glycosyltransferase n=2 Tax=Gluconacetobacter sacchari TaxID=92759 RepID=A0A7W4NP31_9PROT|nr:glycosyltransferase [Gluconacetobacter sacchari]MBB2161277.1 glycosyltransferase [Gluconacetobacter sacchari]GBQ23674.1 glycosyltransferase [Gluconacetobacter sacchari DSM 12717]
MPDNALPYRYSWDHFDLAWIRDTYPETREIIGGDTADIGDLPRLAGLCGYSPNPYFDERYYVARYPDVRQAIDQGRYLSGFDHYRKAGHRDRNPHWLFSEQYYVTTNPDIGRLLLNDSSLRNGYDHYLRFGDAEFRTGSWFFDPLEYIKSTTNEIIRTPFSHYLLHPSGYSNSAWFDTDWYMATYPQVLDAIRRGEWRSILHHYLHNKSDGHFDPCPYFSERFYVQSNPDIRDAILSGQFNSGYEHFLLYGLRERRQPHPDVDLARYACVPAVQEDLRSGRRPNPFIAYCRDKGAPPDIDAILEQTEDATKYAFEKKCTVLSFNAARRPLDFSHGRPDVSVIIALHNHFDMTINALTALRASHDGGIQLILVDGGSQDETRDLERYVRGATILRLPGNVGFVRACNAAIEHVAAPFVLFLNNDTEIQPGSIAAALQHFRRHSSTGVIGAKLIRTNGLLQEAGTIIFRDGSVAGYLRGRRPDSPEANFVRRVDTCSGACLFTRTDLLRRLGGFDEAYIPAYYEETDYCVRVWKSGSEVVYDPSINAIHYEYGSSDHTSGAGYINRNRLIFNGRHTDFLARKLVRSERTIATARSPFRPGARRILFVEDQIPLRQYGSGFTRANDIVTTMAMAGHEVTLFPIFKPLVHPSHLHAAFPDTVEIIWDRDLPDLERFLAQRAGLYDVIWVSRTQNVRRLIPVIEQTAHLMPQTMLVADTEAVSAVRDEQKDRLHGMTDEQMPSLTERLRAEFECLFIASRIVAVNARDARLLSDHGFADVRVLGHMQTPRPGGRPWTERSGLLFVGAIHHRDSPNFDALEWLVTQLWPMLEPLLPDDAKLLVAGHIGPAASLAGLPQSPRIVYLGEQADLTQFYDSARLFIAPTRYAAGIPYKLHEAAAHGLPAVASDILCRQLDWADGDEILWARANDSTDFLRVITNAYDNPTLWARLRYNMQAHIAMENDYRLYTRLIEGILTSTG